MTRSPTGKNVRSFSNPRVTDTLSYQHYALIRRRVAKPGQITHVDPIIPTDNRGLSRVIALVLKGVQV